MYGIDMALVTIYHGGMSVAELLTTTFSPLQREQLAQVRDVLLVQGRPLSCLPAGLQPAPVPPPMPQDLEDGYVRG